MAAVPLAAAVLLALMPPLRAQVVQPTSARPATVAAIALAIRSRAIQDSRCYLMNGGAVESFFISEDTPVGSVIGTLSVNGDPSEAGDISLRLQEQGAAVGVAAGSKNLTLLRPLDREELRGPSNVYVNVRCDRRRTTDPSFVIPVSVRVWDVNDNAPAWAGAPFRARLSELTAVGARVLRVKAADADQPGPHATIVYSVLPGPNSEYLGFLNELDGVIVVKKPLDFETLRNFTVTIRAQDQGTPPLHNDTTLTVEVLDADDQNPKFTSEHYTAIIPDDAQPGTILETSPGPISAVDQDVGINAPLQYSTTGDYKHMIVVERDTGRIVVTEDLLKQLSPVTVVVKATQVDNADRYALATLAISRLPTEASVLPVRFARRQYDAAVPEDAPPGTVLATLHTDPPHHRHQSPLQFYVSDRGFLEKFAINGAGEVLLRRALDYEAADAYHYQVMVTDGLSNDTAAINITVLNVNEWEPRFRYPQYEFRVEADPDDTGDALLPVGRLDVFDGDKPDTVSLSLRGPDASMLRVNELGEVFVARAALRALNASALHVVATAVDSGSPPRQTSVPVVVHVGGRAVAGARGGSLLALFAAALALLALLVCALLAYIYRTPGSAVAALPQQEQGGAAAAGRGRRGRGRRRRRGAHERPSTSARRRPLGRGVAGAHHPRARQEAQLGRARAARTQGQRGGGAPRRHQPRGGRPHEPHRVLLAPDSGADSDLSRETAGAPRHQRDASPAEPNGDCTLPDSTNSELLNTNALLLQNFNEALNYKDRHHLPKVFDRAIKNISEAVSARDERNQTESQSHPLYPKLSREENLPGSTADADGLSNLLYHHSERTPHRTQKDNDRRNLNFTTSEEQAKISFSSILDKHTAIYRQYALPDTTSPINNDENYYSQELSKSPYYPHISQQNYRKENKTESKKSVGLENNPNYSSGQGDKLITQYDAPIIKAPSEFSDEQSPLPPMTMSFSNMMTMPVSNVHLTERQLPTEYVAVPVKKISQVSKQNKQRKKNTPPKIPMKPTQHAVSPVKYIPINLDNPMVNPEFLPKTKGNFPTKKVTPPKRPPSPVEYIPIPINPKTRQPQVFTRVHKGMRHPHPGSNRPRTRTPIEGPVFITQPHESQRYVMHPSAPRLSYSSMDGWRSEGPSSFASIDPRKLRTQRVSPLLFVPMYKPL